MVIASLCFVIAATAAAATPDDEVSRWLEAAADDSHYVLDDGIALRSGPSRDAAHLLQLRIGTRVRVDAEHGGWTRVEIEGPDEATLVGWIPAGHLTAYPPKSAELHERWQEANATGSAALTLAALERAVAFDGTDVDAWWHLIELLQTVDAARADAIRAHLEGRRRVYVAADDGQVLFSFVPAMAGSIVATVIDEAPFTPGSEGQARLAADARALDGAAWFSVGDDAPAPIVGRVYAPAVRRARHRRGLQTVQLGATHDGYALTTPAVREADGWWHLTLQGYRLRVTPTDGVRCVEVSAIDTEDAFCVPWEGVRVEVQRGPEVEVVELTTGIDGC
jgi:hypothetical protein